MMKNNNKKPEAVVIAGASAGVGRAIAWAFAKRGAHIGLLAAAGVGAAVTGMILGTLFGKRK